MASESHSECITITFSECVENHVGNQQIGNRAARGFSVKDIKLGKAFFKELGLKTKLIHLGEDAYVLVVRNAVSACEVNADDVFTELKGLKWDTQCSMYGRVVNKHARYNLCFNDKYQAPDYKNKKGTVIPWSSLPGLSGVREMIDYCMGDASRGLKAEGNRYYDVNTCGIGYHGDTERRKVVGVRFGASIPLVYQWFHKKVPVGDPVTIMLGHGDLYIMSEKAVGTDWKSSSIRTLRHAAGCKKYTVYKPKPPKKNKRKRAECPADKILNPATGKYVKRTGKIGRAVLAAQKKHNVNNPEAACFGEFF